MMWVTAAERSPEGHTEKVRKQMDGKCNGVGSADGNVMV
jgi:hypothetical protein